MTREEREAKREEIRQQTEEFLKNGGKIEVLKMGECNETKWNYTPMSDE